MRRPGRDGRRLRLLFAVLTASAAVASVAAPARADDWGTPGLDGAHGRSSAERSGAQFGDGGWTTSFRGGARVLASPVAADGFVVTVDLEGAIHALRADSGQIAWQTAAGSAVQGTPAIVHGRVFVPTIGNKLVALRLGDGAPLWTRDLGGMTLSSPTPVNDDVVLAAGFPQRQVVRLSGATGEIVWQSPPVMEQFSNTSPVVGGGLVVVGSNGGHYYAFDAASGALRWSYAADGIVHLAAPIILGGRVYMAGGGESHRVHAVDAGTGAPVPGWPVELPTPSPDVAGTLIGRQRAVSSFAAAGTLLLLQTRLDDGLDTNADGAVDTTLSREMLAALDPSTGTLVWQRQVARAEHADQNDVPKFFVCPTPAAFATDAGATLVAVASSLDPTVLVLDAATGLERARHTVAGAALASPLVTNGRLVAAAMNGAVQALVSSLNHAPVAPVLAGNPRPLDAADVTLRWLPAVDADGELPTYELRIDADGEVLESWEQQIFLPSGTTSTKMPGSFAPGTTYSFAVRARDGHGALSAWSAPETFSVVQNPAVTIAGTPAISLAAAVGSALPGDVIVLGAGTTTLSQTLVVRGGVGISGAGAGRTTLDATGLGVGIRIEGTNPDHRTTLDGMAVAGADTCLEVTNDTKGVRLSHIIVRDCRVDGIAIRAGGDAALINLTLVGNGTAVHAAGPATIRNSLLASNGVALAGDAAGVLTSTYDDLFGNQTDYKGLAAGTGDRSQAVAFADLAAHDLRLLAAQPSTDEGDPADPVGDEPAPNGDRINLGAFGGTADAEKTASSTTVSDPSTAPSPTTEPGAAGQSPIPTEKDPGGCAVAAGADRGGLGMSLSGLLLALAGARRRRKRR